jgi:hypothetical protein
MLKQSRIFFIAVDVDIKCYSCRRLTLPSFLSVNSILLQHWMNFLECVQHAFIRRSAGENYLSGTEYQKGESKLVKFDSQPRKNFVVIP